ncbi:type II toxin-antitoxin system VapC family toxin [Thauera propionica]|uniref:type II toxin-antitoxin system VapC family toxin n=1 Tax=Thauera propionica TaxID=2019431 RepID=UPI0023EF895E|nr:type II toxin-antitoxin system VapC family toxin [Thauera propionica]MDD3677159.1 type II toxin-antitoxin system VapC family toxin [Thauera propionica]MDY0067518.1 type II toxin-antitoxin system VapC family toxin [Steroidobacteraceae bacterium]
MAKGLIVYLDPSAFLKLYIPEPESGAVRDLVSAATVLCTHLIGYAEMRAALSRAARIQRLDSDALHELAAQFERDWETLRIIVPDSVMVRRAGALAEQLQLRGYDSVHLAAAEAVAQATLGGDFRMAVFDKSLGQAARTLGLSVFDAS